MSAVVYLNRTIGSLVFLHVFKMLFFSYRMCKHFLDIHVHFYCLSSDFTSVNC